MSAFVTRRLGVIGVTLEKEFQSGTDVIAGPRSRPVDKCRGPSICKRRIPQAALDQRVEVGQDEYLDGDMGLVDLNSVSTGVQPGGSFSRPDM
jgi:hypothetical protein